MSLFVCQPRKKMACEDTARRWPCASQEQNPHEKLKWPAPRFSDFPASRMMRNKFLLFKLPYGILLRYVSQPKLTNTGTLITYLHMPQFSYLERGANCKPISHCVSED